MLHILTGRYEVIDPWFGRDRSTPIELDMGCGKGGFLLALAERYPERLILGSDVMLGRLRKVQRKIDKRGLTNVELLRANNLDLAGYLLPDRCITRLHILCPDPWPKNRHRGRRLITSEFIGRLTRLLVPGGVLHLATDHPPYQEAFRNVVARSGVFSEAPDAVADIADLQTDFEKEWLSMGRRVPHYAYVYSP